MARSIISGPGLGLPPPQFLYPSELNNAPYDAATNKLTLNTGDTLVVPAGKWWMQNDGYSVVQYLDPVTGCWLGFDSARTGPRIIDSDGFTVRVANLTSCPVAAVVTTAGTTYSQSTTTVTPTVGNSTWLPIVGGAIGTTATVVVAGSGYTIPPIVVFPAPPLGLGVQATGYATLSGGTVASITIVNRGAGYTTAPVPVILPSPFDPNIANIVQATATTSISAQAGHVCAILCTNNGDAVASMPSLTIAGGSGTAAASAVVMYTMGAATGSGGANFTSGQNLATTTGGVTNASATIANPNVQLTNFIPRPAVGVPTIAANAVTGFTWTDTGLFCSSDLSGNLPTILVLAQTGSTDPSGALTLTAVLAGTQSALTLQPL
jgi:hypothetical protein